MTKNILKNKSWLFAVHIIKFTRSSQIETRILQSKQPIRSIPVIEALIRETKFIAVKSEYTFC